LTRPFDAVEKICSQLHLLTMVFINVALTSLLAHNLMVVASMLQDNTINAELCLAGGSPAVSNNFTLMLLANSVIRFMEKLIGAFVLPLIQKAWSVGNLGTSKSNRLFVFVFIRIALHACIVLMNIKFIALYRYT
jgi:hypothetical protein